MKNGNNGNAGESRKTFADGGITPEALFEMIRRVKKTRMEARAAIENFAQKKNRLIRRLFVYPVS